MADICTQSPQIRAELRERFSEDLAILYHYRVLSCQSCNSHGHRQAVVAVWIDNPAINLLAPIDHKTIWFTFYIYPQAMQFPAQIADAVRFFMAQLNSLRDEGSPAGICSRDCEYRKFINHSHNK